MRKRRIGRILAGILAGAVLVMTAAGAVIQYWGQSRITTLNVSSLLTPVGENPTGAPVVDAAGASSSASPMPSSPTVDVTPIDTGSMPAENILVIGSDTREGQGKAYGQVAGERSDTTMLVHLNAGRTAATVLSIPRDLWVSIPACNGHSATQTRFNAAFSRGGVECTIKTVTQLAGLPINHVIVVDFKAFKKIVNAVGGLRVCIANDITDQYSGLSVKKGIQTLNGKDALALARSRHGIGDGSDIGRIGRQQQIVKVLADQVKGSGLLSDPVALYEVADAAVSALSVDDSLGSLASLAAWGRSAAAIPTESIEFVTWPFTYRPDRATVGTDQVEAQRVVSAIAADHPVNPPKPAKAHKPAAAVTASPFPSTTASPLPSMAGADRRLCKDAIG